MKCSNCGYENESHAKFCKQCGYPLKSKSKFKDNKTLIICVTTIICLMILVAAFALISHNDINSNSGTKLNTQLTIHPKDFVGGNADAMISGDQLRIQ